jgi:hypothetical protein
MYSSLGEEQEGNLGEKYDRWWGDIQEREREWSVCSLTSPRLLRRLSVVK